MSPRKFLYIVCIITLGLCGCHYNKSSSDIIKINPFEAEESIKLSEIVDSIKIIKLETDSNCIIGRAHTILIKEKYIYVLDVSQQIVFVFNKSGNYVSKLDKRGKGPGEYLYLGPLFVSEDEQYIEIIATSGGSRKLLKYSNISFDFLGESPMPNIAANSCKRNNNMYYFATQQIENEVDGEPTNAGILVVEDGEIKKKLFDKNIRTNNSGFSPNIESFTLNDKNELFVSIMYDNTFYKLEGTKAHPILSVDFGKHGIDNSIGDESLERQLEYINSTTGLAFFPVLNLNNLDIMSFSYYVRNDVNSKLFSNSDLHQYVKLKKRNKTFHTKKIKNDITDFPDEVHFSSYHCGIAHEVSHKDYLVDIILPGKYFLQKDNKNISKTTIDGIGEITIDNNPIILLMKLKKDIKDNNIKSTIAFSEKTIDFGTLSKDTIVNGVFYLKNVGENDLFINNVEPECGCTGFKLDKKVILPGDSTRLSVNFSSEDSEWGLHRKAIFIDSNTEEEYHTLYIKYKIRQKL